MKRYETIPLVVTLLLVAASCRKEETIVPSTPTHVADSTASGDIKGFFLLNEGNMGSNKATLDYFDYESKIYKKNIYAERNPYVVKELGDVGNDIGIYGSKLYAVINCSNFVEVMDAETAKHITQISIPNCRYITFHGDYAYVSSYAGPVLIDPNARLGYVAKIDTATMTVVDTCIVGYQPEEMAISEGKLYVANSGGYRVPDYDSTVSVISLNTFKVIKTIGVAINLHRMEVDGYGQIWVSSRGDYYDVPSKTCVIDSRTDEVTDRLDLPNSGMALCGDSLYVYGAEWNYGTKKNTISYAIVDVRSHKVLTDDFITDDTKSKIEIPYGIAVNPATREIFVTDARDYVTPGKLYCLNPDGTRKWSVTTGDIPAHIVFTTRKLN
ncbi:MAG: YncE family protein [Bacteroidales bacterium]|jgi:DNA-binding beta-propeller fold protein YncE|nr:YncE family protein [Bacteroidales bacterium]MCI2121818.1 YncE family protein [Bacteroidales bacterium]MCI2146049.1 YncE family protein [Bacteroidales bacterium]